MDKQDIIRKMREAGLKAPARGEFIFIHWDQIAMLIDYERKKEREECAHTDRLNKDEELLRQAFDAMVNVLAGADYDDPYASLREAAKALSDRLGGGLK